MLSGEEKQDSRLQPRVETNDVEDNGLSAAVMSLLTALRPTPPCAWNAWVGLGHVAAAAAASTTSSASTINTTATTKCELVRFGERWKRSSCKSWRRSANLFFLADPPPFRCWAFSVCAPTHTQPATHQTAQTTVWLESPSLQRRGGTAKPCVVSAELRSLQQRLLPQERASTAVPPPYEMRCSHPVSRTQFLLT